MNKFITVAVLPVLLCPFIFACNRGDSLSTTVSDADGRLTIKVDARKNGRKVHYDKDFDLRGLTKTQRDSIIHHVFDSLHLGVNETK